MLSQEILAQYDRDGYVMVSGLIRKRQLPVPKPRCGLSLVWIGTIRRLGLRCRTNRKG